MYIMYNCTSIYDSLPLGKMYLKMVNGTQLIACFFYIMIGNGFTVDYYYKLLHSLVILSNCLSFYYFGRNA